MRVPNQQCLLFLLGRIEPWLSDFGFKILMCIPDMTHDLLSLGLLNTILLISCIAQIII